MKIQRVPPDEAQRFRIAERLEIEHALNKLIVSRALLSLVVESDEGPALLSVLLQQSKNRIWLDPSRDAHSNQLLLAAIDVLAVTTLDQVQVQFPCKQIQMEQSSEFGQVLSAEFPVELVRLQRRENYRLETSLIHPVKCLVRKDIGFIETSVVDISVGGMSVLAYKERGLLEAGEIYHGCRLTLPDSGEFAVSMVVRSLYDVQRHDRREAHRAGCQFIDLPASIETQIQRYIIRVERERRSRFT